MLNFKFNLIEKLKLVFNFNKKASIKRYGVIEEGEDSLYVNCEGSGPDGGLLNKGKRTKSINTKWVATKK